MPKRIDISKVKIVQIPILDDEWRLWKSLCGEEGCSPKLKVRELMLDYIHTKMMEIPKKVEEEAEAEAEAEVEEVGEKTEAEQG